MISRIKQILEQKNLTPSRFADKIDVPRSTISHILSGRNKPSLEVIQKILNAFPDVPIEWLIQGKGSYSLQTYTLFGASDPADDKINPGNSEESGNIAQDTERGDDSGFKLNRDIIPDEKRSESTSIGDEKSAGTVEKVIILYADSTFREYKPSV